MKCGKEKFALAHCTTMAVSFPNACACLPGTMAQTESQPKDGLLPGLC